MNDSEFVSAPQRGTFCRHVGTYIIKYFYYTGLQNFTCMKNFSYFLIPYNTRPFGLDFFTESSFFRNKYLTKYNFSLLSALVTNFMVGNLRIIKYYTR